MLNVHGVILCQDCNDTLRPHPFYCTVCGRPLYDLDDIDARECVRCQIWYEATTGEVQICA